MPSVINRLKTTLNPIAFKADIIPHKIAKTMQKLTNLNSTNHVNDDGGDFDDNLVQNHSEYNVIR